MAFRAAHFLGFWYTLRRIKGTLDEITMDMAWGLAWTRYWFLLWHLDPLEAVELA